MSEQPILAQVSWRRVLSALKKSSVFHAFDEEAISTTLLSQVSRDMFCLNERFGSGSLIAKPFYFGTFNKYGKANDPNSESGSGADFALVIGVDENRVRLAVFQAKKAEFVGTAKYASRWCADIARRPKNKKIPSQLIMLLAASRRMIGLSKGTSNLFIARRLWLSRNPEKIDFATKLHWIHYLVYAPGFIGHLAVSNLQAAEIQVELDKKPSRNEIETARFADLLHLIDRGVATNADQECEGWLTLDRSDLRQRIGPLLDLMTVIFVDDRGDGSALDADADDKVDTRPSDPAELQEIREFISKQLGNGMRF